MKSIRHFHFRDHTPRKNERQGLREAATVVIDHCPTNEALRALIIDQIKTKGTVMEFPLYVGIAILHPEDQYNKKKGVEIASKKAEKACHFRFDFEFKSNVVGVSTELVVNFYNTDKNAHVRSIGVVIGTKSTYPEIVRYSINKTNNSYRGKRQW